MPFTQPTAQPTDAHTSINGNSFHYRDWGGEGQPVALVHGLASNCRIWDLVAPILSRRFRVVALDQRGHGESFKPDTGYDFATVTADLRGFLGILGIENPIIVGHSWGADVALEYAINYPASVRGICFVDGGTIDISGQPGATLEAAKERMAPPLWTGVTLDAFRSRIRSRRPSSLNWGDDTPAIEQIVLANFDINDDGTIVSRLSRENHFRIIEALWEHKPFELYPRVGCPVLLMPCRQSDPSPEARRWRREEAIARAEELLPISKTVWMEDSIHDVPLQRPELVADTIGGHIEGGFFG